MARGEGKLSLQNVGGGGGGIVYIMYDVLTSQVYGGKSISKGANATPLPLKATLELNTKLNTRSQHVHTGRPCLPGGVVW